MVELNALFCMSRCDVVKKYIENLYVVIGLCKQVTRPLSGARTSVIVLIIISVVRTISPLFIPMYRYQQCNTGKLAFIKLYV